MLSKFAKFLLVSTSLSPILGAVAIKQIANQQPYARWIWWLVAAILLVLLCRAMLKYAEKNIQRNSLKITEFERNDQEALAFLIAYMLPLVSSDSMVFDDEWMVGTYTLVILFVVIVHVGAFHFNPVMGLFGYHFYTIKDQNKISNLLISKKELHKPGIDVETVSLSYHIYLHID